MNINERLNPKVLNSIREAIREASGNEVLIVGNLDKNKKVVRITTAARGHSEAVSALKPYIEKGDVVLHNHPSGNIIPSSADLRIASQLGNQGIGFYIVDNSVEKIYVVAEPIGIKEIRPLMPFDLAGLLENGGRLCRIFPDYEERASQVEMLKFICDGFNKNSICIAEAGTGVGKSLAYLIPSVDWILKNEERVVVSTATINLQQQLIEKDIPLVKRIFDKNFCAYLVKGRGNYLCITRLQEALEEISLFEEEESDLEAISKWAQTTGTGSRSDLSFYPSADLWSRVCSEADACYGLRCPNREHCFVLKSRREAASAQLLVANHHLLFSDLAMRLAGTGFESSAVLPPFQHIIFDEAQNVEKSATSFFSANFSRFNVAKYIGRLFRQKQNRVHGLLHGLEKMIGQGEKIKEIRDSLKVILERADFLNGMSLQLLADQASLRLTVQAVQGMDSGIKTMLLEPMQELNNSIIVISNLFKNLFDRLNEEQMTDENNLIYECRIHLKRLLRVSEICERFLRFEEEPRDVYWIESQKSFRGDRYIRFVITPLDIGSVMKEAVYEPYQTIVFTSATLTVSKSFDYWKTRVGFDKSINRECAERIFPSPFNYQENVLLGIPKEAPMPDQIGYQAFVADFIKQILLISEGRALVLFTSYALLQETIGRIQDEMMNSRIPIMQQGEDDRNKLLNRFRDNISSVLFATDSFWEGVDAPGESLQVVILSRLPFRVPTDPVLQARMDAIAERGGNPFWELSLPAAVMRLKQGFGRLIRRKDDKGAVLILDSRIVNKPYGSYFLSSLPETRVSISSSKGVIDTFEDFIVRMRRKGSISR